MRIERNNKKWGNSCALDQNKNERIYQLNEFWYLTRKYIIKMGWKISCSVVNIFCVTKYILLPKTDLRCIIQKSILIRNNIIILVTVLEKKGRGLLFTSSRVKVQEFANPERKHGIKRIGYQRTIGAGSGIPLPK